MKEAAELNEKFNYPTVMLAGNPNVGKSSLFNLLTGMHQHTGNWSGKTVAGANGLATLDNEKVVVIDLPGSYSLSPHSKEEQTARDMIIFSKPDVLVYVCSALFLERNLLMLMQITDFCDNIILCINMEDELEKNNKTIDTEFLSKAFNIPTVLITTKKKKGIANLKFHIKKAISEKFTPRKLIFDNETEEMINALTDEIKQSNLTLSPRGTAVRILCGDEDFANTSGLVFNTPKIQNIYNKYQTMSTEANTKISEKYVETSKILINECVKISKKTKKAKIHPDSVLTGKITAYPIMLITLFSVLLITIVLANYPSDALNSFFKALEPKLHRSLMSISISENIADLLVYGIYRVVSWIISVMLPPMAIFFPLFTLLEDSGYLPRIAFNLDGALSKCGGCGKQALTMCMGFGCNCVGVSGCRIIASEKERLIAILTNNFIPCNGRFPIIIALSLMFFSNNKFVCALSVFSIIIFSISATLVVSKLLSKLLLKNQKSEFILELPPYRMPKIVTVIVTSFINRTVSVLSRALIFAVPCSVLIWILGNIQIGDTSLLNNISSFLDPFASLFGLDGAILLAFILGIPANEIAIPIILMTYMSNGCVNDYESITQLKEILVSNGWTLKTAICTTCFSVMHWPCAATLSTIYKETKSAKYTLLSFALPTMCGLFICFIINFLFLVFGQ